MQRAIEQTRSESEPRKKQIDDMLADRPFEEAGAFAAYHCQNRFLRLRPWEAAPCDASIGDVDAPTMPLGGKRAAAQLLQRMLDNGLSRYEPNPVAALARPEVKRKAS